MLRAIFAALALAASATPALALDRGDLIGEWQTEWANAAGQAPDGGGAMRVSADTSADGLDGVTPAPGMDGVMNATSSTAPKVRSFGPVVGRAFGPRAQQRARFVLSSPMPTRSLARGRLTTVRFRALPGMGAGRANIWRTTTFPDFAAYRATG